MIKKILVFLTFLFLISCNLVENKNILSNQEIKVNNFTKTKKIPIKLNLNSFKIKDSDNGNKEYNLSDVKGFEMFLSSNPQDPFESGTNPNGDYYRDYIDDLETPEARVAYVPAYNEPYFLVIAAFDKPSYEYDRKNITKINTSFLNTVLDDDRRFYVSTNSVTINDALEATFSNTNGTAFIVNLSLDDAKPVKLQTEIKINDGVDTPTSFTAQ
ncbi:MAG: hypothetical protein U0457_20515 [Candidatus Sericytochromatia bacterium]